MSDVLISLLYKETEMIDLGLPETIPNLFLARSLSKALDVRVPDGYLPVLYLRVDGGERPLPAAGNLRSSKVLNGSFLSLKVEQDLSAHSPRLKTDSGMVFALSDLMTVGRTSKTPVEIDLSGLDVNKTVSRRHAIIRQQGSNFSVEDTGSTNGTWVNGEKVLPNSPVQLRDGDTIVFGSLDKGVKTIFHQ